MAKRICIVFILCVFAVVSHAQVLKKNKVAPDFKAMTTDSTEFHLKEALKDKYVLLNFTGINCGYCWRIYPYLIMMQKKYKEQLEIVCVHNLDQDTPEQWEKMAKVMYKEQAHKIIDNKLTSVWKASFLDDTYCSPSTTGWPQFFLIGKDGKVVKEWFGAREKKLIDVLEKELGRD